MGLLPKMTRPSFNKMNTLSGFHQKIASKVIREINKIIFSPLGSLTNIIVIG